MRILFVGAGSTGGYFGGRLQQAGRDVTFLVREGRAAALEARGLRIHTPDGETLEMPARTVTAQTIDGPYDVIILSVKSYALDSALKDMAPAVGAGTIIVPLLNGMRHIDALVGQFAKEHVYGGVCIINTTLDSDGDVVLINDLQRLAYGPLDGVATTKLEEIHDLLSGAGFPSESSLTILQDMWEKWTTLSSLGAVNCLMRGTVGEVVAAPGGEVFANNVVNEAAAIATAAGYALRREVLAFLRGYVTRVGSSATSSMFRDLSEGRPVEADAILGDLVAEAARLGVPAPLLSLAYTNLSVYEAKRG